MLLVQPPADLRPLHPGTQARQRLVVDPESPAQCRHFQQIEHLAHPCPPLRQIEQDLQPLQQRIAGAQSLVGERKRDVARIIGFDRTEHRLDVRRIDLDVRHHHDHLVGTQRRVLVEGRAQLIVQHLHFPLRPVRHVKDEGTVVIEIHARPSLPRLGKGTQFEDVFLQLLQ
jgi:hypothetical protein